MYDWYLIFNKAEFEALGLVSKTYSLDLEGLGEKEIQVFEGNFISIVYDGVMLPVNMNLKNPFEFEGYAIYIDENEDIFLGVAVEN